MFATNIEITKGVVTIKHLKCLKELQTKKDIILSVPDKYCIERMQSKGTTHPDLSFALSKKIKRFGQKESPVIKIQKFDHVSPDIINRVYYSETMPAIIDTQGRDVLEIYTRLERPSV